MQCGYFIWYSVLVKAGLVGPSYLSVLDCQQTQCWLTEYQLPYVIYDIIVVISALLPSNLYVLENGLYNTIFISFNIPWNPVGDQENCHQNYKYCWRRRWVNISHKSAVIGNITTKCKSKFCAYLMVYTVFYQGNLPSYRIILSLMRRNWTSKTTLVCPSNY